MSNNDKNEKKEEDATIKILVLGDSMVGKTSLLLQYVDGYFPEIFISTIGVEYKEKIIELKNTNIKLQIWDTCGQEKYRSLAKNFMKGANGILYVYDVSKKETFEHIKDWMIESQNNTSDYQSIIVGNKIDLPLKDKVVSTEMLTKFINQKNIKGIEVSAKNGTNVEDAFLMIAKSIVENMTKEEIINKFGQKKRNDILSSHSSKNLNKKKCC